MASRIVGSRANLPILNNLLLTASEENFLQIESSNLDISIRLKIPAKVEAPGQTTVPARKFSDYISSLKEEKLTLKLDKTQLLLEGENNKTAFITIPPNEYPDLPARPEGDQGIVIQPSDFHRLIRKTVFATAGRSDQIVLTGVLFDFAKDQLTAVATDSFRLSYLGLKLQNEHEGKFLIPGQTLNEVDKLVTDYSNSDPDASAKIQVYFSAAENQIFFQLGDIEIVSRLLEASFPDYQRLIPQEFLTRAIFDRGVLIDAVKTSSIFASREGQLIRLSIDTENQLAKLTSQSSEVGSHQGQVPAKIEGNDIELGFNSRYLLEGLGSFESNQVQFNVVDARSAVVIRPLENDEQYQHIVMPMDINI
jgi:DNA polymerase-3 subunit beta